MRGDLHYGPFLPAQCDGDRVKARIPRLSSDRGRVSIHCMKTVARERNTRTTNAIAHQATILVIARRGQSFYALLDARPRSSRA